MHIASPGEPTAAYRKQHIAHKRAIARSIATAIDADMPLVDWEKGFVRFVLTQVGATDDHAAALRKWAANYEPGKRAGRPRKFDGLGVATLYALLREEGETDHQAIELMLGELRDSGETGDEQGLRKAMKPHLSDACAHLRIDPAIVNQRKPSGRPRKK